MSWTVACFCGTVYPTSPSGACPSCGEVLPAMDGHRPVGQAATHSVIVSAGFGSSASAPQASQRQAEGARS